MTEERKSSGGKFFLGGFVLGTVLSAVVAFIVMCIIIVKISDNPFNKIEEDVTVSNDTLITQEVINKTEYLYQGILESFYFEENIDAEKMRENMYRGIISSLDDPYAEYYTEEELIELFDGSEGIYYGIGSYVSMDEESGYPKLTGVFDESPAKEAGLRDGDIIYEVDGENVGGLTLTEVVNKIKGPEGTTVDLTIFREGEDDYLYFTVERRKVTSPTVKSEMKDNEIGYIQLTEFDDVTSGQFKEAYDDLNKQNMKALVIDLRSNHGGNLSTVLEICEEILPEGIITYTEDKYGNRNEYRCKGKTPISIPLVVLTNEYTASASELMSGAIRDYGLGVLIGTNTYGKGIVQSIYTLADGSGVKLTTSRYYTPSGVCIHGTGLAPDIEVPFDSEAYYAEESYDNQLEYALDYLKKQLD